MTAEPTNAATASHGQTADRLLGIHFFKGTADEAVARFAATGGLLVVPASPALVKLNDDEGYRRALLEADLVLPDSGLVAALARAITSNQLQ